jgi:hypothetical protein
VKGSYFFRKKRGGLLILSIIFILIAIFVSGETPTELTIADSPPYLISDIPNQSWAENENNMNAFDLDNYFKDDNGDNLSFSNSSVEDIRVSINQNTHEVSFFPRYGFSGLRNVTFYASDSVYSTLSNIVMLNVGLDNSPPKWSSPSKNLDIVYQNNLVSFSTAWQDDRALRNYIFSINQGAVWENYSSVNFSGTENTSAYSVQIRAPSSNIVYWKFYAFDSSGNVNSTAQQSFVVSAQQIPNQTKSETNKNVLEKAIESLDVFQNRKLKDFQLNVKDFKISLKQGSSKTTVLKITNTGTEELLFSISSKEMGDFLVFSEKEFSLLPGRSNEITIDFNIPKTTIPGQYFGFILVNSGNITKSIPVVIDIKSTDLEFDLLLNISEGYAIVKPGQNVKANISIFNIKDIREINAEMYYAIKDYTGKIYNFSEEQLNFSSSAYLERELQVPEITQEGEYIFYARVSDEKNIAIDSASFEVGTRFNLAAYLKIGFIFILVLIFAILLAIFMVKYQRDKRKERLIDLYVMLNKLKNLIKQDKQEEALNLFIKIKTIYNEPIPKEIFEDKNRLKQEILSLYENLSKDQKKINVDKESSQESTSDVKSTKNIIKEADKKVQQTDLIKKDKVKDDKK